MRANFYLLIFFFFSLLYPVAVGKFIFNFELPIYSLNELRRILHNLTNFDVTRKICIHITWFNARIRVM